MMEINGSPFLNQNSIEEDIRDLYLELFSSDRASFSNFGIINEFIPTFVPEEGNSFFFFFLIMKRSGFGVTLLTNSTPGLDGFLVSVFSSIVGTSSNQIFAV